MQSHGLDYLAFQKDVSQLSHLRGCFETTFVRRTLAKSTVNAQNTASLEVVHTLD